jgi:hypothetical protein
MQGAGGAGVPARRKFALVVRRTHEKLAAADFNLGGHRLKTCATKY